MRQLNTTEIHAISGGLFSEVFATLGAIGGGTVGFYSGTALSAIPFLFMQLVCRREDTGAVHDQRIYNNSYKVLGGGTIGGTLIGATISGGLGYWLGSVIDNRIR